MRQKRSGTTAVYPLGEAIGDVPHHLVDAENLLDDDDGGAVLGLRIGHVGAEGSVLALNGHAAAHGDSSSGLLAGWVVVLGHA